MRLRELTARVEGIRVLSGAAQTGRQLRSAYTTDLADPGRYLSGGELVLTSGLWWDGGASCRLFAGAVAGAHAAALGFGVGQIPAVPEELVAACEDLRLPLLEVAAGVSFQAITETILGEGAAAQNRYLAGSLTRSRRLHIAAAEGGLEALLRSVSAEIGASCWLLAPTGRIVGGTAPAPIGMPARVAAENASRPARGRFTLAQAEGGSLAVYAVPSAERRWKPLLVCRVDSAALSLEQRELVEDAARVIAVIDASRASAAHEGEESAQLLVDALARDDADPGEVAALMRVAGVPQRFRVRIAVARSARPGLADLVLGDMPVPGVPVVGVAHHAGDAVRLLEDAPDRADFRQLARDYLFGVRPLAAGDPVRVGISDPVTAAAELRRGLLQAHAALNAAAAQPAEWAPVFADELKSARFLLAGLAPELLAGYRTQVLGDVLAHDAAHGSGLEDTLRAFLEASGSYRACAAALHLHVNTVRYRIQQIRALTGLDVGRLPDQVTLYIAVHAAGE